MVCSQVGVFTKKKNYKAWLSQLKALGATVIATDKELAERYSYLLYYPAAKTFKESKANVKMLKKKGVKDVWLFLKGPKRGMISIGLYSFEEPVLKIQKQLKDKGIHTEIKTTKSSELHYKVRFKTKYSNYDQLASAFKEFRNKNNRTLRIKRLGNCSKF